MVSDNNQTNERLAMHRREVLQASGAAVLGSVGLGNLATTQVTAQRDAAEHDYELPDQAGTYRTASESLNTLNPLYSALTEEETAIGRTIDSAYAFDNNNELFGLHYKDISTDDGGNVWTIQLRENLQFSDPYGQVTAEDYVYQVQELHQSEWALTVASPDWTQDHNVEQTGEFEFQVELPTANILYPQTGDPSLYPIPKGLVQPFVATEDEEGLEQSEELRKLQFTGNLGPFVLDNWEQEVELRYSRNDTYYLRDIDDGPKLFTKAPHFQEASIKILENQTTRTAALETGEIDAGTIPLDRYEEFLSDGSVSTYKIPRPYNNILSVNQRSNGWQAGPGNLFRYKEMRQAAACAIDKQNLIQTVFEGAAKPHYTWQPEFSRWYPDDRDSKIPKFGSGDLYGSDVAQEKAMQAFERAGLDYTFDGDTMRNPDGDQVSLDVYYSSDQDIEELTAEFIAQEFSNNLGIEVTTEAVDRSRFYSEYWTVEPEGGSDTWQGNEYTWDDANQWNPGPRTVGQTENWDMSVVYKLNTYPRNPLSSDAFFDGPTTFYNPVGYYPEFDAQSLWADARNASSEEELQSVLSELFVKLAEDQPYVMTVFEDSLTGYNSDLVGPTEAFNNGWDFPAWHYDVSIAHYTTEQGVVDMNGLRNALEDWRIEKINTDLLQDVLTAWQSGNPV